MSISGTPRRFRKELLAIAAALIHTLRGGSLMMTSFLLEEFTTRSHRWKMLAVTSLVLTASFSVTDLAQASNRHVRFCNKSKDTYAVAYAFDKTGDDDTRSQGWEIVNSCRCATLFNEDVKTSEYFYYVRREGTSLDARVSGGSASLCIRAAKFDFMRVNKARKNCENVGGVWVNFARDDAKQPNWTLNFGSGAKCID